MIYLKKSVFCFWTLIIILSGCVALSPPSITKNAPISGYKYVYITPTTEKTSVSGGVYGNSYGTFGSSSSFSVNPTDLISGFFFKRGYVRLPELDPEYASQTLVINYGETGVRQKSIGVRTIEIVLQVLSAKNNEVLAIVTAEGDGSTEAEAISNAVDSCLNLLFWEDPTEKKTVTNTANHAD